jgi:cytochrome c556
MALARDWRHPATLLRERVLRAGRQGSPGLLLSQQEARMTPSKSTSAVALFALVLGSMALGTGVAPGAGQDGMQALTSPEEATVARRLLMLNTGNHRDAIASILAVGWPSDETEMRGHLLAMSYMLYAIPSLYRAEPNPFTEQGMADDPARVSLATPEVWEDFDAFSASAHAASDIARRGFYAETDDVIGILAELDAACTACHATFRAQFGYDLDDLLE